MKIIKKSAKLEEKKIDYRKTGKKIGLKCTIEMDFCIPEKQKRALDFSPQKPYQFFQNRCFHCLTLLIPRRYKASVLFVETLSSQCYKLIFVWLNIRQIRITRYARILEYVKKTHPVLMFCKLPHRYPINFFLYEPFLHCKTKRKFTFMQTNKN